MNHAATRIYTRAYDKAFHKLYLEAYEEGYKEALRDYNSTAIKRMLDNHFENAAIQLALEVSSMDIQKIHNLQTMYCPEPTAGDI